jgi:hypothetical protein
MFNDDAAMRLRRVKEVRASPATDLASPELVLTIQHCIAQIVVAAKARSIN